ncbi:MAG: SRPBCC family protein [Natronospirillum sp.]
MNIKDYPTTTQRSVDTLEVNGKPARSVILSRHYNTPPDDLWDALTNRERLPRWFLPVSGELVEGGHYQLEGNAGGTIRACEAPHRLDVTWEFGGGVSWVEVLLAAETGGTRLTLTHTAYADEHWEQYGPGAVGIGWDLGWLSLAIHLTPGAEPLDEATLASSPEGKALIARCGEAWGEADIRAGEDPATARAAAQNTIAFYSGENVESTD